jgi:hypothetical protein
MNRVNHLFHVASLGTLLFYVAASAQAPAPPAAVTSAPPPPATKIEAFKPAAGTVVTLGYNELGSTYGVSVDAREMRDTRGNVVRGVTVEVTQSEYRQERAFVDADELPELLKGIDALLSVKTNPTTYQNFEVRYTTKGDLQITAFNRSGQIIYAVQAGRIATAQAFLPDDYALRQLRTMFETASRQLGTQATRD